MAYIGCTIKQVPPDKLLESAEKAIEINPANAPNIATSPASSLRPPPASPS